MRRIQTLLATVGLLTSAAACGKKDASNAAGSAGSAVAAGSAAPGSAAPAPAKCPAGNAVKDGACVAVVTAEKIAAVAQQQSRLDELAKLLDQVDTVAAPVELFDGIRQLEPWQKLKAKSEKLAALDAVAGTLDTAVKTLRTFKASLGEASGRLGNLKGELDRLMADTGAPRKLEEVRALVSSQLRGTVEPLAGQVTETLQRAVAPLTTQLAELSDLVVGGCAMAKLSGGGDKLKELCGQAKEVFGKATLYVDELKGRPAQLFTEVTSQLTTQLDQLVDAETQKLVASVQAQVGDALKLPASGAGSAGSAAAPTK